MNRRIVRTVLGSVLAMGSSFALAGTQDGYGGQHGERDKHTYAMPDCPVMGEPIDFAVSTATDDGPAFFCCNGCVKKYIANPSKYAAKVAAQRKALAGRPKVQVSCPVTGEPVDQKVVVEHNGGKVNFCCKGCAKKFQAEPGKFKASLANSYTYQTKCPVMDEEIDPKSSTTLASGLKIYYCCKGCDKKFLTDPAKYVSKLVAQGFQLSTADIKPEEEGEHDKEHDHGDHGHGEHDHGEHGHGG